MTAARRHPAIQVLALGTGQEVARGSSTYLPAMNSGHIGTTLGAGARSVLCRVFAFASLYDAAFAALVRQHGKSAGRMIVGVSLVGGFACTVGWPLSMWMVDH